VKSLCIIAALALSYIALVGCSDEDKDQQIAKCQIEGLKIFHYNGVNEDLNLQDYVSTCMRANGYPFLGGGHNVQVCSDLKRPKIMAYDPACYSSFLDRLADAIGLDPKYR
jgi:hypothetical protein